MGLGKSEKLKVALEKAFYYLSGNERSALDSLWYLSDPKRRLTRDSGLKFETLADAMGRVGMADMYVGIEYDTTVIYPESHVRKANGRMANVMTAKLDSTGCLAVLSFIGERHELHAFLKRPTQALPWELDSFCICNGNHIFTLECEVGSASLPFVERGLDAFSTAVATTLFDPEPREQYADIELGKIMKADLEALYARFQNARATLAPR